MDYQGSPSLHFERVLEPEMVKNHWYWQRSSNRPLKNTCIYGAGRTAIGGAGRSEENPEYTKNKSRKWIFERGQFGKDGDRQSDKVSRVWGINFRPELLFPIFWLLETHSPIVDKIFLLAARVTSTIGNYGASVEDVGERLKYNKLDFHRKNLLWNDFHQDPKA